MRRLALLSLPLAGLLLSSSCNRSNTVALRPTEEQPAVLASVLAANDPKVSSQFGKGFYGIEQNAWRWTMGKFSAVLRPPSGAAQRGATLKLTFSVPEMARIKSTTLSATVAVPNTPPVPLPPEIYSKEGQQTYTRDIPASALQGDTVTIDFALDKYLPAGAVETRELGVVVSRVALEAK